MALLESTQIGLRQEIGSRETGSVDGGLLTAEDLERMHGDGLRGELIRGVFHEKMSTGLLHGVIAFRIGASLLDHAKRSQPGIVAGTDVGVLLELGPDTVREPDVAFVPAHRVPAGGITQRFTTVVPDVVAEVASPSDGPGELAEKARMWLSLGVRLVWVVQPETRTVDVHRTGQPAVVLGENAVLSAPDVLPGFEYPLSSLFSDQADGL